MKQSPALKVNFELLYTYVVAMRVCQSPSSGIMLVTPRVQSQIIKELLVPPEADHGMSPPAERESIVSAASNDGYNSSKLSAAGGSFVLGSCWVKL